MKSSDILQIERTDRNERIYIIRWQMTHLCNYYCDFCIQGNRERHLEQAKNESPQIRKKICSKLITFIEKEMNGKADIIHLHLIGGEVTILKDFIPILKRLMKVKFEGELKVHITTNMSLSTKMCRKLATIALAGSRKNLSVRCSYYKEFISQEEFLEKLKALQERSYYQEFLKKHLKRNRISIAIGYPLFTDQDYKEYLQFKEKNAQYAKRMRPFAIRDYKTSISQTVKSELRNEQEEKKKKVLKVIWKDGKEKCYDESVDPCLFIDEERYFQPKGFLCDVGCHNLNIDPQGNMSRCLEAVAETTFGNIFNEMPGYMTEMSRCQAERCTCHSYYSLLKNDL